MTPACKMSAESVHRFFELCWSQTQKKHPKNITSVAEVMIHISAVKCRSYATYYQ